MNYGVFRWDVVYFGVYTDRQFMLVSGFSKCSKTKSQYSASICIFVLMYNHND